jgi:hypothetical protein
MNDTQISSIAEGGTPGDADVDRINEAGAFSGGFFGSIPRCYRAYPIGRADWQWPAVLGFFAGMMLFRQLQYREYVSRVRRSSGAHRALPSRNDTVPEKAPRGRPLPSKTKKEERSLDEERADW